MNVRVGLWRKLSTEELKLLNCEEVKLLSHVRLFATPWTVAYQAPPSMGFSRQEYLSGLPFPSPGDLPDPGIKPRSPAFQADTLTSEPPGKRCSTKLLRAPWTVRRSNQSILKEISPRCSLEGLMLRLKLQYFDHLMRWADSLEKTLMLGRIGGRRRRGRQRMRWLDGITDSVDMGLGRLGSWWWTGSPGVLWFMGSQRVGHDWATELTDWMYVC